MVNQTVLAEQEKAYMDNLMFFSYSLGQVAQESV